MAFSVDTRRKREEFEGVTSYVESDDEARLASRGAVLVEASPMERIKRRRGEPEEVSIAELHSTAEVGAVILLSSCSIMVDTSAAGIASYLGCCKTLLHFRTVGFSVHEQVKLAVDATFRHHLELSVPPAWHVMHFTLPFVIFNLPGNSRMPIGEFVASVLKYQGCWCSKLQWPWLRNRLEPYLSGLDFLPEQVWLARWKGYKLAARRLTSVATALVDNHGETGTMKQLLNECIFLVKDEACISSCSEESDSVNLDCDIFNQEFWSITINYVSHLQELQEVRSLPNQ